MKLKQWEQSRRVFENFTGFDVGELDYLSPLSMELLAICFRVGVRPLDFINAVENEPDWYWLKRRNIGIAKVQEIKKFLRQYKTKLEHEIQNRK